MASPQLSLKKNLTNLFFLLQTLTFHILKLSGSSRAMELVFQHFLNKICLVWWSISFMNSLIVSWCPGNFNRHPVTCPSLPPPPTSGGPYLYSHSNHWVPSLSPAWSHTKDSDISFHLMSPELKTGPGRAFIYTTLGVTLAYRMVRIKMYSFEWINEWMR